MVLSITAEFVWPLMMAAAMNVQLQMIAFSVVPIRKKLGVPYPDMGSGRHAAKLSDEDWTTFMSHQRGHYNYVEQFAAAQSALLISGIFYPRFAAAVGAVYIVGRQLYAWGYRSRGPNGRMVGVALLDIALFTLFGTSLWGTINAARLLV